MTQTRSRLIAVFILAALVILGALAFWHLAAEGPRVPEPPSRSRLVLETEAWGMIL